MEMRIKSNGYQITPEVQAYLNERVESLGKLLGDDVAEAQCDVEVGRDAGHPQRGEIWSASITIIAPGMRHHVSAKAEAVNAAIDAAKDEMMEQLRRAKHKRSNLLKRTGSRLKEWMRFGRSQ